MERDELLQHFCDQMAQKTGYRPFKIMAKNGNTNTGNLARRAFQDPEMLANILNLPVELVKRISYIWIVIRSTHEFDPDKFYKYCQDTKKIWKEKVAYQSNFNTSNKLAGQVSK